MKRAFDPQWLKDKELVPVLTAMFDFMDEYRVAPSLASLHEYMEDRDQAKYNSRWKTTLTACEHYDDTKQMVALRKAKDAAASYSLQHLITSQRFQQMLTAGQGDQLQSEMAAWLSAHNVEMGEGTYNIQQAFDKLIDDMAWTGHAPRLPTGISCIDEWSYGGLRPGQVGIIMAPTGGGKSVALLNIAHHAAVVEQKPVLFITNELTVNEQAERFLARMQVPTNVNGVDHYQPIQLIQEDPTVAYRKLKGFASGISDRLYITSVDLNTSAMDIEEHLKRMKAEKGFAPALIVIDYMERMKPTGRVSKDREWIFMGEIAKELVRLAKMKSVVLWTACQTNRGGLNAKADMSMEHAQGSIRHFQEAASVIAARTASVEMDADGVEKTMCMEFQEKKQRHAAMRDRKVYLEVKLDTMRITDKEVIPLSDVAYDDEKDDDQNPKKGRGALKSQAKVKGKTK
jgi:hypothetical protein